MTVDERANTPRRALTTTGRGLFLVALTGLTACVQHVENPPVTGQQKLAFAYFQRCINPIFFTQFGPNTCGASGCHDSVNGTGGALRLFPGAQVVDVTNPANTPDAIRAGDMYKNFISAQGQVVISSPDQSRLLNKPLLRNVLHGGGQIFASAQDPNVKLIEYWITNPVPLGQDEFSTATYNMFTPPDPNAGTCNTTP
ncbi:MAG TPA: hypothetical protein VLW55_25215 [Burkholderiaceae bacterium]|nr:hypothetical protein [Burkholderiaceae bacterium]